MGRRSYGSGQLFLRADANGRETYYGSWWVGTTRVKRRIGLKRRAGSADGLTRTQAEAELRRKIASEVIVAGRQRRTMAQAGEAYIDHLEHVMERKRTTIGDYRGYLRATSCRSSPAGRWTRSTAPASRRSCTTAAGRASRPRRCRTT